MNPDKTRQVRSNDGWGDKPSAKAAHLTGKVASPVKGLCPDCMQPNDNPYGRCTKCHAKVQARLREMEGQ